MKIRSQPVVAFFIFALGATLAGAQTAGNYSFTVSMEQPTNHLYHVVFHCDGLKGGAQDFKMPVWTPGYYVIQNFANNVTNFSAADASGKALTWERPTNNTWRVQCGTASSVTLTYDVRGTRAFVGSVFLDDQRGYISPAGVFVHPAGQINHPVTVTIIPNPAWSTVATGLDAVSPDKPHTYLAPDFDILYDSPILMGNLKTLPKFEIQGVPHNFVAYNPSVADPGQFMQDLKAVVEAGIAVIGEVPYKHYTFLGIGPGGGGGIEHLNSASVSFSGNGLESRQTKIRQLSFLAHEYFHNFNVKRIRPIELGPFDYDHENRTKMLWVSEGFTSYYEWIMLRRAGMMDEREILDAFQRHMANYENRTGHLFQSASGASWDVWMQGQGTGGGRGGGGSNRVVKTISYYEKGPVLGLLLDFKIRNETKNQKSLDTAMRALYQEYYKDKKRGWTEAEFRAVCEKTAGTSLEEFFEYANTTTDIDYGKYLGYAGLDLDQPVELADAYLGAVVEDKGGKPTITAIETGTAAQRATLGVGDEIKYIDGGEATVKLLGDAIADKRPGDKLVLVVTHDGKDRDVTVTLGHKYERSFHITPSKNPTALQSAILKGWQGEKN